MLDPQHQSQPQTGLAKLLQKYEMAPHTTKEGEVAWCLQTFLVNELSGMLCLETYLNIHTVEWQVDPHCIAYLLLCMIHEVSCWN